MDGNNKLGLEDEADVEIDEDEEEEDRINNEYVLQEDEEVRNILMASFVFENALL